MSTPSPAGMSTEAATIDARLNDLLGKATIEVYSKNAPETLRAYFPAGRDVYASFLPGDDVGKRVEIAKALREGGYNPVLHVPARQMVSAQMLEDYIGAAARDAQINRVLVIAGDSTRPRGSFATAQDVIESGALQKHGVRHVDVAGHPEGNVGMSDRKSTRLNSSHIPLSRMPSSA